MCLTNLELARSYDIERDKLYFRLYTEFNGIKGYFLAIKAGETKKEVADKLRELANFLENLP